MTSRNRRPIFVVGCPRSGTTLLYHMLLSAGGFAVYEAETHAFDLIAPAFGGLRTARRRTKLMREWLQTHLFELSGLEAGEITEQVLTECRTAGDFLRIQMESIARHQGVDRWAECTPAHLLYMSEIKKQIPEALFIHIVRDGRDVALSLGKLGWVRSLPWGDPRSLAVAAMYWEWFVRRGRRAGPLLADDYLEVRFERLVAEPLLTLPTIAEFIGQRLDYERIRRVAIGSVGKPNTSFPEDARGGEPATPVGRWKRGLTTEQVRFLERLIGPYLHELDYEPGSANGPQRTPVGLHALKRLYHAYFSAKHWARSHTPLGRFLVDIHSLKR